MTRRLALAAVLFVAACAESDEDTGGWTPTLLEAIGTEVTVEGVPWGEESTSRREPLTVTGSGQEYTILTEDLKVVLHSPGHNDITGMSGFTGSLNVAPTESTDWPRTLVITSNSGWAYIANVGNDDREVDAALTMHAVDFGAMRATIEEGDTWRTTYYDTVVHADDGDVSLHAGDSKFVTIKGGLWRVTAIAAYIREPLEGADLPNCTYESEVLSYEMLLYPEGGHEKSTTYHRDADLEPASLDCEE